MTYHEIRAASEAVDNLFSRVLALEYGVDQAGTMRYAHKHTNPIVQRIAEDKQAWSERLSAAAAELRGED